MDYKYTFSIVTKWLKMSNIRISYLFTTRKLLQGRYGFNDGFHQTVLAAAKREWEFERCYYVFISLIWPITSVRKWGRTGIFSSICKTPTDLVVTFICHGWHFHFKTKTVSTGILIQWKFLTLLTCEKLLFEFLSLGTKSFRRKTKSARLRKSKKRAPLNFFRSQVQP